MEHVKKQAGILIFYMKGRLKTYLKECFFLVQSALTPAGVTDRIYMCKRKGRKDMAAPGQGEQLGKAPMRGLGSTEL